jgi:hypothetical protein
MQQNLGANHALASGSLFLCTLSVRIAEMYRRMQLQCGCVESKQRDCPPLFSPSPVLGAVSETSKLIHIRFSNP